ncbi:MAG: helix-turn-helix transcriptional regulator [Clostridia bacterium]|nr:helix-turn-helix transcriptional regulator [Clostridia bacterium]
MEIQTIFYHGFSQRSCFELIEGERPWDVFLLVSDGSFSVTFGDMDEEVVIEENEIAFFPANLRFHREVLHPITFHQIAFLTDTAHPFYRSLHRGKLEISKEQTASLIRSMESLFRLPENRELAAHMAERVLIEQYLCGAQQADRRQGLTEDVLTVMQYMNDHLHEKLDMDALADSVYLSHSGLLWKFHRQMGMTPSHYLTMIRLRYAKQLLLEGDLRINEIAARCGYANAYYFTNAFRKQYGTSPSQFRKNRTGLSEKADVF